MTADRFAIEAPSATPAAIIQKVHDDIAAIVADASYQKALHGPRLRTVGPAPAIAMV